MLPATISVMPKSPKARQNASTAPASTARQASGSVTLQNTDHSERPSVRAACSRRVSTPSKPAWAARTSSGSEPTHAATTAAFQVNASSTPICSSSRPSGPGAPISTSR